VGDVLFERGPRQPISGNGVCGRSLRHPSCRVQVDWPRLEHNQGCCGNTSLERGRPRLGETARLFARVPLLLGLGEGRGGGRVGAQPEVWRRRFRAHEKVVHSPDGHGAAAATDHRTQRQGPDTPGGRDRHVRGRRRGRGSPWRTTTVARGEGTPSSRAASLCPGRRYRVKVALETGASWHTRL
jgi:hypothetical protein